MVSVNGEDWIVEILQLHHMLLYLLERMLAFNVVHRIAIGRVKNILYICNRNLIGLIHFFISSNYLSKICRQYHSWARVIFLPSRK